MLVGCTGATEVIDNSDLVDAPTPLAPTRAPAPSKTPGLSAAVVPSPTSAANVEETSISTIDICPDEVAVCDLPGHFWLASPIFEGDGAPIDGYRYGSNANGTRETHHGVEFEYPYGTDVHSVAEGEVIFAGNDKTTVIAWTSGFYGNVVVLKHTTPFAPNTIYTLYGHLSEIDVSVGDEVSAGQVIGKIGASGTAIGSHLHFEVRETENDYSHNQNPILWVEPAAGTGVIAGKLVDQDGELINGELNVQRVIENGFDPTSITTIQTYQQKYLPVGIDVYYGENFAVGNLLPGKYRLSGVIKNKVVEVIVEVKSKRLAYVNFIVE